MAYRYVERDIASHEIENWIVWCWHGSDPAPGVPSRCYSAEGRYVPPASPDEEERQPTRIINHEAAQRVQAIFDRKPLLTRQVLRYEYTQRAKYDQWGQGREIGPDGKMMTVWLRVGNVRRRMARLHLKIGRREYLEHVASFRQAVREEFKREVCA